MSKIAPFGKPIISNGQIISNMMKQGFSSDQNSVPSTFKLPSWKPTLYKGKNKIEFIVQERISCVQYDKQLIKDRASISGTISCKVKKKKKN